MMGVTTLGARVVCETDYHFGRHGKVVDYLRDRISTVVLFDDGHECEFVRGEGLRYERSDERKAPAA